MTAGSDFRLSPWTAAAGAVAFLALGAVAMFFYLGDRGASAPSASDEAARPATEMSAMPPGLVPGAGPVRLTLTADAVARAGIAIGEVVTGSSARSVQVPAVVEPNGYRTVTVTALAAGQLTSVRAELGQQVEPGDVMAEVYSPELAQAQREVIALKAELEAVGQRVSRLGRLTIIGAASEQELERERAEQTRMAADLESARAKLRLLGLSDDVIAGLSRPEQVNATMVVPATSSGVVTARMANRGQNVDASSALFTVVDLSSVWVVGDVYERDLANVRLGSDATVTTTAIPGEVWRGQVSYIDPQIAMATRTARVRVEVPNPGERLRLGMFAEIAIADRASARDVPLVPASAIQTIGAVDVVYLADANQDGVYVERAVRLGRPAGTDVEVVAGLSPGDRVVTQGSFSLRAERDRLGLPPPQAPPAATPDEPVRGSTTVPRRYEVAITERGLSPATVRIPAWTPAEIAFTRRTDNTCGTDLVLPDLGIERDLPLDEPVVVTVAPRAAGELSFACGMGMLRGTIVIVPVR